MDRQACHDRRTNQFRQLKIGILINRSIDRSIRNGSIDGSFCQIATPIPAPHPTRAEKFARDSLSPMGFGFYRKILAPCLLRYCDISGFQTPTPTTQISLTAACLPPTHVSHALVTLQTHPDLPAWFVGVGVTFIMLPHLQRHVCSRNQHPTPLLT